MNERIQELIAEADRKCSETRGIYDEILAELIVRECGKYLNSPEFIGRSDLDWSMVLNEHFGVEE
jgi:hypothetical protein